MTGGSRLRKLTGRTGARSSALIAGAILLVTGCASADRVETTIDRAGSWMPVDLSPVCIPVVSGTVDGRPAGLVLDTGASVTLVDSTWAAGVGLEASEGFGVSAAGETRPARRSEPVDIGFGGVVLHGVRPLVLDLSWLAWYVGGDPVVVVGAELFESAVVDLDYRARRIAFYPPGASPESAGERVVELPLESAAAYRLREVSVSVGADDFALLLDSGSNGNLTLDRDRALGAGVRPGPGAREGVSVGIGGETRETIVRVDSVALGDLDLSDVPSRLAEPRADDREGTLGCGLLHRFRVVFDYPGDRLELRATGGWREVGFVVNRSGLVPGPHPDGIEVRSVIEGEAAAVAGLEPGDVVVAVDGIDVADLEGSPVAWIYGPEGTRVEVTLSDGDHRTIVLR